MAKFKANWQITGLSKKPINQGDVVDLSTEAAQLFVDGGSLSPVEDEAKGDGKKEQSGGTGGGQ
jgi:hypothetical protein